MSKEKHDKFIINDLKLMAEWNWEKNNESGVLPYKISSGSEKKVWWVCREGHEWEAAISNKTKQKSGCPYCAGKKAIPGETDFATL